MPGRSSAVRSGFAGCSRNRSPRAEPLRTCRACHWHSRHETAQPHRVRAASLRSESCRFAPPVRLYAGRSCPQHNQESALGRRLRTVGSRPWQNAGPEHRPPAQRSNSRLPEAAPTPLSRRSARPGTETCDFLLHRRAKRASSQCSRPNCSLLRVRSTRARGPSCYPSPRISDAVAFALATTPGMPAPGCVPAPTR